MKKILLGFWLVATVFAVEAMGPSSPSGLFDDGSEFAGIPRSIGNICSINTSENIDLGGESIFDGSFKYDKNDDSICFASATKESPQGNNIGYDLSSKPTLIYSEERDECILVENVPGDGSCGYYALDLKYQKGRNSREILLEGLDQILVSTDKPELKAEIEECILQDISEYITVGEHWNSITRHFFDEMLSHDLLSQEFIDYRNFITELLNNSGNSSNFGNNLELLTKYSGVVCRSYIKFLRDHKTIWMNLANELELEAVKVKEKMFTAGIADAIAVSQGRNLMAINEDGKLVHVYGSSCIKSDQSIILVHNGYHFMKGFVVPVEGDGEENLD